MQCKQGNNVVQYEMAADSSMDNRDQEQEHEHEAEWDDKEKKKQKQKQWDKRGALAKY